MISTVAGAGLRRLAVFAVAGGMMVVAASAVTPTFVNLVPGNVSTITTDIPGTWWAGGSPNTLTGNSLAGGDRWLTGNYDQGWASAPVVPPGVNGPQTNWPYNITLTFTTPQSVKRVREIYNADGGGFSNVTITARDTGGATLAQLSGVQPMSRGCWQAVFSNRLLGVKSLQFTVTKHADPAYYDVRLNKIQVFDDGGGQNLAKTATITADFSLAGGLAISRLNDEDVSMAGYYYSPTWNPPGNGGSDGPRTLFFTFNAPKVIRAFRTYYETSDGFLLKTYQIQVPDGAGGRRTLVNRTVPLGGPYYDVFVLDDPVVATQVCFYATDIYPSGDPRLRMSEFEIIAELPKVGTLVMVR